MLHLSHGSKRPSWFAATRTRWRKSTRNPRSLDFRTSRPRRAPTRPSTDTPASAPAALARSCGLAPRKESVIDYESNMEW